MDNSKIYTIIENSNICSRDVSASCSYPLNGGVTPNIFNQQLSQLGPNGQILTSRYISSASSPIRTNNSGIPDNSQISSNSYNAVTASYPFYAIYRNTEQQFYNPPQQFYNPPKQICNPPQQVSNPPQQVCNPPQQVCNSPQQFYNPPLCNPTQYFCNPTHQFCNSSQQSRNLPQQSCNPSQQFYNPPQQFCIPPQQFCNPQQQFCNSTQQLCNPLHQQQFSYEVPMCMSTNNQQSTAQFNTLINGPQQFDHNGHIFSSQPTFSSLGISDDNLQNNCNGVNTSLLSYEMGNNYGQQFSTITCPQYNQSYSSSQHT
jgi:hypothetical protein